MLEHASGHIRFHSEGNTGLHTTFSACWNIHWPGHIRFHSEGNAGSHTTFSACWNIQWATSSFTVKEMQAHTPHFLHATTCVRTCHISSSKVCEVTRHVSCMIENVPGMPSVIFLKNRGHATFICPVENL